MAKGAQITKLKGSVLRSPKGVARYAYIGKPDDSTYGKNRYRITVVFDKADPEYVTFAKKLAALAKLHAAEIGKAPKGAKIPIKLVDEKMSKGKDGKSGTGDPVGTPYVAFETNSKYVKNGVEIETTVPTFNAKGQEEVLMIYGGDIVRVEARFSGWLLDGDHGVKGYLNAVQQLKSNWSGGTGNTFGAEDEYINDEDAPESEDLDDDAGFDDEESTDDDFADDSEGDEGDNDEDDPLDGLV